jgi:hypothetical protein
MRQRVSGRCSGPTWGRSGKPFTYSLAESISLDPGEGESFNELLLEDQVDYEYGEHDED